jgi:hypothetical protein
VRITDSNSREASVLGFNDWSAFAGTLAGLLEALRSAGRSCGSRASCKLPQLGMCFNSAPTLKAQDASFSQPHLRPRLSVDLTLSADSCFEQGLAAYKAQQDKAVTGDRSASSL